MISDTINKQITEAMKAKDEIRVSTLKLLSSELHNAKIDKKADLTKEDELKIVRSEAKKRRDAIEAYEKALRQSSGQAGAKDRLEREKKELKILKGFLPIELSNAELSKIVDDAISGTGAKSVQDMGKVMSMAMEKVTGRADGKKVAEVVKNKLSEK